MARGHRLVDWFLRHMPQVIDHMLYPIARFANCLQPHILRLISSLEALVKRYDLVTFDMGYTLVYFHPSDAELLLSAYHSLGLHPDPEALRRAQDLAWQEYNEAAVCTIFEPTPERDRQVEEDMARKTLQRLGLYDAALVGPLVTATKQAFTAPGTICLYPEVPRVLQTLRDRGYPLAVISNWSWDLDERAEQAGLTGYFDLIVASARSGCDKPHPNIFQQTLQAMGAAPERAIHIGDSYDADVAGARGVGMDALWLDRAGKGGHPDIHTIRDLTQVLDIVLGSSDG